jgi:hypothetical protein
MFDLRFKDFIILNNYVGIKIATIVAIRYDSKTLIPLFVFNLSKNHPFTKHPSNYDPSKTTIGSVWCKIDSRSNCHGTCKFLVFAIIRPKIKIKMEINNIQNPSSQFSFSVSL